MATSQKTRTTQAVTTTTTTQPTSTSPVPGVTEKQEDSDDLDLKGGLLTSLTLSPSMHWTFRVHLPFSLPFLFCPGSLQAFATDIEK